jgi:hypothetical protein
MTKKDYLYTCVMLKQNPEPPNLIFLNFHSVLVRVFFYIASVILDLFHLEYTSYTVDLER